MTVVLTISPGFGQTDAPKGTNPAVMVSLFDPASCRSAGVQLRQTGWLSEARLASPPRAIPLPSSV